jgi:hypothetical protein
MKRSQLIFPIIILSFILNLYGIKWGLPTEEFPHPSFHPDETASLESSISILNQDQFLRPGPEALGNGSMQFYIAAIIFKIGSVFGIFKIPPTNAKELANLYFAGRILTILMSAAVIYLTFLITKSSFGLNIALLSSFLLASIPAIVVSSHYFRSEIPALFWILLTFYFSIRIFNTKNTKYYVWAAISAGFATSTKYNSIFVVLLILATHIMSLPKKKRNLMSYFFDKRIIYSYFVFIGAFIVGSIGILLYFDLFKERILKQLSYQRGSFLESIGLGPGWLGYFTQILPYSLGIPLQVFSIFGLIWSFIKRKRWDIILLVWFISYYIILSSSNWWVVRYTVPLMPPLAILLARFIFHFPKTKLWKTVFLIVGLTVGTTSLIYSLMLDSIYAAKDPRIMAHRWVRENVPFGKRIGIDLTPAAYYVPADNDKYQIISMRLDGKKLNEIDYYIANDQVYQHYLRLPNLFSYESRYFQNIIGAQTFAKVIEFENPLKLFNWKFSKTYLPHDYLYFQPKITIFRRITADTLQ